MASYKLKTGLSPDEVIKEAEAYFERELGLEEKRCNACYASFEGGEGFVTVTARDREDVEILTREWDYQVRKFMGRIG